MSESTKEPTLKPLGKLSRFPLELRHEIYRYVLSGTYKAHYSASVIRPTFYDRHDSHSLYRAEHDRDERTAASLSILRLSKAFKEEAMPFLYSEGTFSFRYDFRPDQYFVPVHPDINITNLMANVHIYCAAELDSEYEYRPRLAPWPIKREYAGARAGPLTSFLRASRTKISICIEIGQWGYPIDAANIIGSPLFTALKQLTGFKTVILKVWGRGSNCYPPRGKGRETMIKNWQSFKLWEWRRNPYAGIEPLARVMSATLEPRLGKSSMITEPDTEPDIYQVGVEDDDHFGQQPEHRCIIFHPRDHLAAIAKAKRDMIHMQQSMSSMRID